MFHLLMHDFIGRVFLLEEYGRTQSSSVSPRGGYCSSASTPHSSNGGSYGGGANGSGGAPTGASSGSGTAPPMNGGYGATTPTSGSQLANMLPGSPSAGIFNSTSSKYLLPSNHCIVSSFFDFIPTFNTNFITNQPLKYVSQLS